MSGAHQRYIAFNDPRSRDSVNMNPKKAWESVPPTSFTGRRLYEDPPVEKQVDPYAFNSINNILDKTMKKLPDHSSRFGVDNGCANGYCFGHMPGKYATSGYDANYDPQPKDMAPPRFYTNFHQLSEYTMSQADLDMINFRG